MKCQLVAIALLVVLQIQVSHGESAVSQVNFTSAAEKMMVSTYVSVDISLQHMFVLVIILLIFRLHIFQALFRCVSLTAQANPWMTSQQL